MFIGHEPIMLLLHHPVIRK